MPTTLVLGRRRVCGDERPHVPRAELQRRACGDATAVQDVGQLHRSGDVGRLPAPVMDHMARCPSGLVPVVAVTVSRSSRQPLIAEGISHSASARARLSARHRCDVCDVPSPWRRVAAAGRRPSEPRRSRTPGRERCAARPIKSDQLMVGGPSADRGCVRPAAQAGGRAPPAPRGPPERGGAVEAPRMRSTGGSFTDCSSPSGSLKACTRRRSPCAPQRRTADASRSGDGSPRGGGLSSQPRTRAWTTRAGRRPSARGSDRWPSRLHYGRLLRAGGPRTGIRAWPGRRTTAAGRARRQVFGSTDSQRSHGGVTRRHRDRYAGGAPGVRGREAASRTASRARC